MSIERTPAHTSLRERLTPIDIEGAIEALARLRGEATDKQLVAHTIGLLDGRVELLLDAPEIAAALRRDDD